MISTTAEKIKIGLDNFFGPSWHAVVGEEFSFNIDHEGGKVYYVVYGSHAVLVWKVSSRVQGLLETDIKPKDYTYWMVHLLRWLGCVD